MRNTTTTEVRTQVTVIMGDLTGWRARLVYRSTSRVPLQVSPDGRLAALTVDGQPRVGAVVTPHSAGEPVVYLGEALPDQPWGPHNGWTPADMPTGVVSDAVQVNVLAVCGPDQHLRGHVRSVWLPRTYRPMERFDLPVVDPIGLPVTVPCRVLEATPGVLWQDGWADPQIVVAVEDPTPLAVHGWQELAWVQMRARAWTALDGLSRCLQTTAHPLLGGALVQDVVVHDLTSLDAEALVLLPRDVRDALERTLLAMPD